MGDHRTLKAFQTADELAMAVYSATRCFPRDETFGLRAQMRRAAVSVPANIVEGCARETDREYRQFLNIAFGSLRELGYYVELAGRLGHIPSDTASSLATRQSQCARLLAALMGRTASDVC